VITLQHDIQPYRVELWQGMDKVVELLLTPDSSGKVAAHLFFTEKADQDLAALVVCYLPYIVLDLRVSVDWDWTTLTRHASNLRAEALELIERQYPKSMF